jgi:hypothetical protein
MKGWTLDDIAWERFDASRVDPEILRIVKAAAMVEGNGGDYAGYLCNVFHDDPEFQEVARHWGREEIQHGLALGRWAELVDPAFRYDEAFARFVAGFKIDLQTSRSVRGSRSGELVARCIVETGTSSYYTALTEAVDEPVLKQICRNIAADELRHYKLFYTHLKRYLERERIGPCKRLLVALGRLRESEDDELAYAYWSANGGDGAPYDRRRFARAYARRAYGFYRPRHVDKAIAMVMKAVGLQPQGRLSQWLARFAYRFIHGRHRRLARAGA